MTWIDSHPVAKGTGKTACIAKSAQFRDLAHGVLSALDQGKTLADPVLLKVFGNCFSSHLPENPAAGLPG